MKRSLACILLVSVVSASKPFSAEEYLSTYFAVVFNYDHDSEKYTDSRKQIKLAAIKIYECSQSVLTEEGLSNQSTEKKLNFECNFVYDKMTFLLAKYYVF